VVSLNGAGQLVVTANATGPVALALAITDRVANTGQTTFPTMNTTDDGLGGSRQTLQTATALTTGGGGANAGLATRLNNLDSNPVNYNGATGGADTINITGVDTDGSTVNATLTNVGAATTVNDLLGAINGAFAGATATLSNGLITLTANAEGILPLELVITDALTSDGSTRWDNHVFVQTTLGTSTVVDGFTGSETSISGTFTNIDSLRGPNAGGDTLIAPDLNNHWDLFDTPLATGGAVVVGDTDRGNNLGGFQGTDHGNLVASRSTADARIGGATTVGRPTTDATNTTVPITAVFPEQDLIFASFENLVGGSLSDHFDLRDQARVTGTINGSGGNDSIDYRDYTSSVLVDLFSGTATNIMGSAAGGLDSGGVGDTDNSIENAIGGSGADLIAGDNDDNILGDGPGNDYLNGGGFRANEPAAVGLPTDGVLGGFGFVGVGTSGDDIFRLEPVGNSEDIIQDIAGSDTVDFRFATAGIGDTTTSFDMDITSDGLGVGAPQTVNDDSDGMGGTGATNTVDFRRITLPLTDDPDTAPVTTVIPQPETAPSFVENFIGSTFNDYIFIDPLSLSGNFPVGSPPVARSVDGNNPSIENLPGTTDLIPPGDTLDFDSKGKTVLDTGLSLTAVGVGTVAYRDIETLIPFENAPARVLDSTDAGFILEGDSQFPNRQGWRLATNTDAVGGSQYEISSPDADHLARWRFNGVTPGLYRVSASWTSPGDDGLHGEVLSPAAPFTVFDGDRAVAQELIDLESLPDDFTDQGATWEDIGGLVWISGHDLVVELDSSDGLAVVADAIRIERVSIETSQLSAAAPMGAVILNVVDATAFPASNFSLQIGTETVTVSAVNIANNQLTVSATTQAHSAGDFAQVVRPEIEVQNGNDLLLDGNGQVDFGITRPGMEVEKTIRILNSGVGDLTVSAATAPTGFTTTLAAPATVTPGETLTISITMTATTVGDFDGNFLFTTNDLDEDEFSFRVSGAVADSIVIDDEDQAFAIVAGDWDSTVGAGFEADYTKERVTSAAAEATWTFTNLVAGRYRVSATWPKTDLTGQPTEDLNSVTDQARFRVYDGTTGGAPLADTVLSQIIAPDDLTADGAVFEDLASSVTLTGTTLTVQLTHNGDDVDNLLADAIRIERLPDQVLTVTTDAGATSVVDDTGVVSYGSGLTAAPVTKTFTITNDSAAGNDITLTGPITPPAGFSLVQSSPFGTDATAITLNPTQSTTFTLQFDAGVAGAVSGRVAIDTDIDVNDPFNFVVTATAAAEVIDNADAGFEIPNGTIGVVNRPFLSPTEWHEGRTETGAFGGTYLAKEGAAGTDVARWTFSDVNPGTYIVSGTWPGFSAASSTAPFQIFQNGGSDTGGTLLQSTSGDQSVRPNDFLENNAFWSDLGIPVVVTGNAPTTLVVELSDLFTNGSSITADAIRIQRVTDPEITVTNGGADLEDGVSSIDFGTTPAGTPVIQTFFVQNFGARNMFVDGDSLVASVARVSGFSVVDQNLALAGIQPFTSTEIAPGESSVFQIQLDAVDAGRYSGTVEFVADDFDEQLFEIQVTGDVLDAAGTVVDDGDAGFLIVNGNLSSLLLIPGTGFGGDALASSKNQTPQGEATWTFGSLTGGNIYRLSATWLNYLARMGNVTYSIYAGAPAPMNLLKQVQLDQTVAPDDFIAGGSAFEDLMGPFLLPAGQTMITVEMSADTVGYNAVFDAVRLDALTMSDAAVSEGGNDLENGVSTVSFGTTLPGTSQTRTITVTNNGNAALQLQAIEMPNGFSSTFAPVSVAAGANATFDVTLDANVKGDFFGDIVIVSDEPGQNEFEFSVSGTVTDIQILDNGDVGYTPVGFQRLPGDGFQADIDEPTTPGSVTDTATWTFAGIANGLYRVSATWGGNTTDHATNAPFTVYDGNSIAGMPSVTVNVDQEQAPDDFSDDGVFWEDLGVPFNVTNGALTVQLTGQADGIVLADAIRIEPVTTPEIGVTVTAGGATITDGGRLDFGEIPVGAPAAVRTISLTVTNHGADSLELGNVVEPAGYTVGPFGSTTLASGASTTFNVTLDGPTAGTFAGVISIGNNDSDESPFDIVVLGKLSDVTIIDDGDVDFMPSGNWSSESGFGEGFDGDVQSNPGAAVTTDVATWTFNNLTDNGRYRVSTVWNEVSNNASDATYTLDGGAAPQEVMFNQRLAPDNATNATNGVVNDRDKTFVNIGDIYQLAAGTTTLTVSLSAEANGRVVADAVRLELIDDTEIKVTQGANFVQDGGTLDVGTTDVGTATLTTFTIENQGAQPLILGTTLTLPAGYTLMNQSVGTLFNGTDMTTIAVGGTPVTFDLQLDAATAATFAGLVSFDTNDAEENPFNFNITGLVNPVAVFDGTTPLIIDDGDIGFTSIRGDGGEWFNVGGENSYQSDARVDLSGSALGTSAATWTASGTGTVRIAATYDPVAFGKHEVEYRIYDGPATGTPIDTVLVSQASPSGAKDDSFSTADDGGTNWDELGVFTFSGTITVVLEGGGGRSVADAIRFSDPADPLEAELVGVPLPTERDLVVENLPEIFDTAINTWVASGQVSEGQLFQLQNIIPVITDLPGRTVGELEGTIMFLDINAAGNGWFVDTTPDESSEFNTLTALTERVAGGNSHAVGNIDLLTVVLHEFGHVLGKGHVNPEDAPHDLMLDTLPTGIRRVPVSADTVTLTAPADLVVQLPEANGHVDVTLFDGHLVIQSNHTVLERIAVAAAQTLTINGTEGLDNFRIDLDQSGTFNFDSIVVHGYGGDDDIVLDGVPQLFSGDLILDGGAGNDRIEVRGTQCTQITLNGADGDDSLFGGLGSDTINGGAGDDMFFGGSGDDRVNGGDGNDLVHGNSGHDTLVGNSGDDSIIGGSGHDVLTGGTGDDNLSGQHGNDTLLGHDGDDVLNGGAGRDALSGGAGNDQLRGGSQNDLLSGGIGNDGIQGNSGHDTLAGDDGDDSLTGGQGSDAVDGGAGTNYVFGKQAVDSLFGASALREELLQNPSNAVPALAEGSDILVAVVEDSSTDSSDSSADDDDTTTTPGTNVDGDFNVFAEWIDLV